MRRDPHAGTALLTSGPDLPHAAGAVVLLHGRGASGADILAFGESLDLPELALFAPEASANTWYPYSFLAPIEQNEPWLSSALGRVGNLVSEIASGGVPREKIVVAGFSQGACLATEFMARHPSRYGALIAFTGGLIGPPGTSFRYPGNFAGTPAFLGAGDPDPHVPWSRVEESAAVLRAMGADVDLQRYSGMPHIVSQEEVRRASEMLAKIFRGATLRS